jgi:hypothetical protein
MPIANVGTNLPVYCSTLIFTVVTSMQSLVLVQQKLISRFANSIPPFVQHTPPSLILALDYAQKLSPSINVELVDGQEVFGQHANGLTS